MITVAEWLYRIAMLCVALALFWAVVRVATQPDNAPTGLIRAEALLVACGFTAWLMLGTPPQRWAVLLELFLWIALAVPCLVLWVLATPPKPPAATTYTPAAQQPRQPTSAGGSRSRHLRAKYAKTTRRA